ncbi:autotransporter domain-containing protein [Martelella limonii]|uniref:autotransporter domain-containing protein n=1 Tax=Martelella limonii TaxID=1647649 RepID=UPI0015804B06|nr:autotransporter domain-containing protein [Martelella limonii]
MLKARAAGAYKAMNGRNRKDDASGTLKSRLGFYRSQTAIARLFGMGIILLAGGADREAASQDLYWNPDSSIGTGAEIAGGPGTWSVNPAYSNWTNQDNTSPGAPWIQGGTAHLNGFYSESDLTPVSVDGTIDFDTIYFYDLIEPYTTVDSTYQLRGGTLRLAPANGTTATIWTYPGEVENSIIVSVASDIVANGAAKNLNVTGPGMITFLGHVGLGDGVLHVESGGGIGLGAVSSLSVYVYFEDTQASIDPETVIELKPGKDQDGIVQRTALSVAAPLADYEFKNVVRSLDSDPSMTNVLFEGNGMQDAFTTFATVTTTYLRSDSPEMVGKLFVRGGYLDGTGSVAGPVIMDLETGLHGTQGATSLGLGTSLYFPAPLIYSGVLFADSGSIRINANAANADLPVFSTGDIDVRNAHMELNVDNANVGIYNLVSYSGTIKRNGTSLFLEAPVINGLAGAGPYRFEFSEPVAGQSDGMIRLVVLDAATSQIRQFWNGSGARGDFIGGSGVWNGSNLNWASDTAASRQFAWAGSVGVFEGTGGTVTVVGTHAFDELLFNSGGYVLSATAADSLTMSPYLATRGHVYAQSGTTTIGVDIADGMNNAGAAVTSMFIDGSGTVIYRGAKSYTGDTTLASGALIFGASDGTIGGVRANVNVDGSSTFGGAGAVGGNVVMTSGTTLTGWQGGTLDIAGDLGFAAGTTIQVALSAPSTSPLFISGDLTLAGSGATILNVDNGGTTLPGGYYALIHSQATPIATSFTDITLGTGAPVGSLLQYTPVGHIYLKVPGPNVPNLSYWDGAVTSGSGAITGGSGVWDATTTSWGDADPATTHAAWKQGDIAVFTANPGTVLVDSVGLQAGGLLFGASGYTLTGNALTLSSATQDGYGEIAVGPDAAYVATISAPLAGPVGVNKTGAGRLELQGANTYDGGTMLTGGTLAVSRDENLGAAAGTITFAGGTLAATASFETTRDVAFDRHGGRIVVENQSDTVTFSGTMSDDENEIGTLIKSGPGTLVLSGTSSYAGGTLVADGTLSVSADANLGAAAGAITLDGGTLLASSNFSTGRVFVLGGKGGTVDVASTSGELIANAAFADPGGLDGGLVKTGAGTLVMAADSIFSGATTISEGRIRLGNNGATGSLVGDVAIAEGAALDVMRSGFWNYGGTLSGSGTFNLLGSSTTQLYGDSSAFGGVTTISNGELWVNGALGGAILVNGGVLSGAGRLGAVDINAGGTITAGTSFEQGTLYMDALAFRPGSAYSVNLAVTGTAVQADLLSASGLVAISGGQVSLVTDQRTVVDGEQVVIITSDDRVITADGDGDGTAGFDPTVLSSSAYVGANIGYTDNTVFLTLIDYTKAATTLCLPGMTANQCATADGILSVGAGSALVGSLTNLPGDVLGGALDQLSGQMLASIGGAMVEDSRFVRDATHARLRKALGGIAPNSAAGGVTSYADERSTDQPFEAFSEADAGAGLWASGYGAWSRMDGNANADTMTDNVGGFMAGFDLPAFDTMRFGALVGYGRSNYSVDSVMSSAASNDYSLGVYGGGQWGGFGVGFGTAYTWHDVSTSRQIAYPGLTEMESGSYNAGTYQIYGEVNYGYELVQDVRTEFFLNAAYVDQDSDGYTEAGGLAALNAASSRMNTAFSTLGVRGAYAFEIGEAQNQIIGTVGWRHAYGDVNPSAMLNFIGGSPFGIDGLPLAEDQALLSVAWESAITSDIALELSYTGLFGSNYQSQNVVGRFNMKF